MDPLARTQPQSDSLVATDLQVSKPKGSRIKRWLKIIGLTLGALVLVVSGLLLLICYNQAQGMVHPYRYPIYTFPSDFGMEYETITLTTQDNYHLAAWYILSRNRAAVIVQHGYPNNRVAMLYAAEILNRHGYGVIMVDQRTEGQSEGTTFTFGRYEVRDLEAAYQYLLTRPDVDPEHIGALGDSMGGAIVLMYAAQNPEIKAVVSNSAFASLQEEVAMGVTSNTGLPPFPFAPLIQWFAEREIGFSASQIAPVDHIGSISPRPVFLMQGGKDQTVPPDSGQRLYDAASEPRQLWFDPDLGHCEFYWARPKEYEKRIVAFFDKYLLEK
jgi:uncharacterized protein